MAFRPLQISFLERARTPPHCSGWELLGTAAFGFTRVYMYLTRTNGW
jgi:hypothetical protein